jgi:BMFP domain-containing protein YqiC
LPPFAPPRQGCDDFTRCGCFAAAQSALPRRQNICGAGIVAGDIRVSGKGQGIMTQGSSRILDDFAKLMTDAAGVAQGARREVETAFRAQAERFLADMDLVKREEHDVVKDMAAKALDAVEALEARVAELEKAMAKPRAAKPKTSGD